MVWPIPGVPLHSPQASKAFAASGAPVASILTYLNATHSTPHQALSWEPKIRENRQFHNTLSVRDLPRVFMGSTIDQGGKALLGKTLAGKQNGQKVSTGCFDCLMSKTRS
jgi:hypothetical protein